MSLVSVSSWEFFTKLPTIKARNFSDDEILELGDSMPKNEALASAKTVKVRPLNKRRMATLNIDVRSLLPQAANPLTVHNVETFEDDSSEEVDSDHPMRPLKRLKSMRGQTGRALPSRWRLSMATVPAHLVPEEGMAISMSQCCNGSGYFLLLKPTYFRLCRNKSSKASRKF
jgi:hypothetical protein